MVSSLTPPLLLNAESLCWSTSFNAVMAGQSPVPLPPFWRLMLLSDGSPTRHLEMLTCEEVEVDLIVMQPEAELPPECPDGVQDLVAPYLRRQIWKRCGAQTVMWAESWWHQQTAHEHLHDPHSTIWSNLRRDPELKLRRDIDQLGQVQNPQLERRFGREGPFWSRSYRLSKGAQVLTVIREVFSPILESYLDEDPQPRPEER